ncbi:MULTISPECIES: hypothetical protein [Nostocales]|uniref:Uncharacterized protein n=3 Tax=Nostocales TaxID=1161 RepID=A0A8S9T558_9CYAN|nr:hypothetical protein [Tolypothrix bouteillei]KAF3887218.1 hypothetical protein DA73_0400018280 [Tolypothrix bouteillei VB521301]
MNREDQPVRCGESSPDSAAWHESAIGGFPAPWGLVNPEGGSPRCSRSVSAGDSIWRRKEHEGKRKGTRYE